MTNNASEPREFWVQTDKKDIQTFEALASESEQYDDDIHVIEKSAYDKLEAEVEALKVGIKDLSFNWNVEQAEVEKYRKLSETLGDELTASNREVELLKGQLLMLEDQNKSPDMQQIKKELYSQDFVGNAFWQHKIERMISEIERGRDRIEKLRVALDMYGSTGARDYALKALKADDEAAKDQ